MSSITYKICYLLKLKKGINLENINLSKLDLSYINFRMSNLKYTNLEKTNLDSSLMQVKNNIEIFFINLYIECRYFLFKFTIFFIKRS